MDFEVCWFSQNPDLAMRALKVLPVEEREERGIVHPFVLTPNCPIPIPLGEDAPKDTKHIFKQRGNCVVVKYPGATQLQPGRQRGNECRLAEDCYGIEQIAPGVVAGFIKPEVWAREEFIKAADEDARREEGIRRKIADAEDAKGVARAEVIDRYFTAACHLAGVRYGNELPQAARRDIAALHSLSARGAGSMPTLQTWVDQLAPQSAAPDAREYDPTTFLPVAFKALASIAKTFQKHKNGFIERIA